MKKLSLISGFLILLIISCSSSTNENQKDYADYFYPKTENDTTVYIYSDSRENHLSLIAFQKDLNNLTKITCEINKESKSIGIVKKEKILKDSSNIIIQGVSLPGHTEYLDSILRYPRYAINQFSDTLIKIQTSFIEIKYEIFYNWKFKGENTYNVLGVKTQSIIIESNMVVYQSFGKQRVKSLDVTKEMTYAKGYGLVHLKNKDENYIYKLVARTNLPKARQKIKSGESW